MRQRAAAHDRPGAFVGDPIFQVCTMGVRMIEVRCGPNSVVAPHEHPLPQLSLVIDGSGAEVMDGTARRESRGTFTYRPPRTPHSGHWEASGGTVFAIELGAAKGDGWAELGVPMHMPQTLRGSAVDLAYEIRREVVAPDRWSELALEGLFGELACALARQAQPPAAPRWLYEVREMLCACDVSPSLSDIAASVSKHPTHVARAFRNHFGITLGEYRRRHVISSAKRALTMGESIGAISAELGFADQSHFSRTFRRVTGQTPSAYRRSTANR